LAATAHHGGLIEWPLRPKGITMKKVVIFALLPLGALLAQAQDSDDWGDRLRLGAVYMMTNTAPLNHLVTFRRESNGELRWEASLPTGVPAQDPPWVPITPWNCSGMVAGC
jgi:hypothetical protein